MTSDLKLVLTTGPDRATLEELGHRLVSDRLAACVNVVGGLHSIYRWEGRVESEDEAMALVKTTAGRLEDLKRRISALHPYDEPEVVSLDVTGGSESYLEWLARAVEQGS